MGARHDSHGSISAAPAILAVPVGRFVLDVRGYQFPLSTEPFDKDWLMVTVAWEGITIQFEQSGPFILASDLARWADGLLRIATEGSQGEVSFASIEPNVAITCSPSQNEHSVTVTLHVQGDSTNCCVERSIIAMDVDLAQVREFGRALAALASRFPAR